MFAKCMPPYKYNEDLQLDLTLPSSGVHNESKKQCLRDLHISGHTVDYKCLDKYVITLYLFFNAATFT